MKNKYPIGATWEAVDPKTGEIGTIWLSAINYTFEVWRWSCCWSDGSGHKSDWGTSYQQCRDEIPMYDCRFKRVK